MTSPALASVPGRPERDPASAAKAKGAGRSLRAAKLDRRYHMSILLRLPHHQEGLRCCERAQLWKWLIAKVDPL